MIWLGALAFVVLFPMFTILLAVWFRLPFEEVGLLMGPRLWGWERSGVIWRINLIPLGSYVKFAKESFAQATLGQKLITHLMPHIAMVLLGAGSVTIMSGSGLWDPRQLYLGILQGALHPLSTGSVLLSEVNAFSSSHPAAAFFSAIAAIGWINLLPIPASGMGQAIIEVIEARFPLPEASRTLFISFSLLVTLLLFVTWSVALVVWLIGS